MLLGRLRSARRAARGFDERATGFKIGKDQRRDALPIVAGEDEIANIGRDPPPECVARKTLP